ncbi:MAG: hypothetical protein V3U71_09370 [Cocleimonas sp.]
MRISSKHKLAIVSAMLVTGVATANTFSASTNQTSQLKQNIAYTAHGTTDRKTAALFKQLMKNSDNLEVQVKVHKKSTQQNKDFSYTITGKTSIKNVKKLMHLLKTNQQIEIIAEANPSGNVQQLVSQQNQHPQYLQQWGLNTIPALYQPFYHRGVPPVFVRGNVVWYPVPVSTNLAPQQIVAAPPYPMNYADVVASR